MSVANDRRGRCRRGRKFVPAALDDRHARLEARALTAPAIWRKPPPFDQNDGVTATAAGTNAPNSNSQGVNSANASVNSVLTAVPPWPFLPTVTVTQVGTSGASVVDLANPGPPNPVGTYGVSINGSHQHFQTVSANSPMGVPNGSTITTTTGGSRDYLLADDGKSPSGGPTNLVETYSYTFAGPASGAVMIMSSARFKTPAFTVAVTGPSGFFVTPSSGSTVTYSTSTSAGLSTLNLTAVTPFSALPLQTPNGLSGAPWPVTFGSSLQTTVTGYVQQDQQTLTYHYDNHFA